MNSFSKFLAVMLRIAIGWHLCYEGCVKVRSHLAEKQPFSSEAYLRNSSGPFRGFFRGLVDDFWGFERLNPDTVDSHWQNSIERTASVYGLSNDEKSRLEAKRKELFAKVKEYESDAETKKKVESYAKKVEEWQKMDDAGGPAFRQEEIKKAFRDLDKTRTELTGPVNGWRGEFASELKSVTSGKKLGTWEWIKYRWAESSSREHIDFMTMGILSICGGMLMIGLFSQLSALAAAFLLAQFYFSMPPWPGLPANPVTEGTYFIVNKNLIEMIALLFLASVPSGVWGGVDALIRGLITRPIFKIGASELKSRDPVWDR